MTENQENSEEIPEEKVEKSHRKTKSFPNKVIIRKLPPNLNEESFIEIISPLPDHLSLYFCPADWSLGAEATTRAYIEFKNEEDIFIFRDKFDGYIFVDSVRGSDYAAIVEYAPFQGFPKSRARKKDKNVGTIESEQHFLNFLELMKQEEEADQKTEPKLEYSYQIKDDKKITSTPLIEFLSAKNQEKRDVKRKKTEEKRKQREDEKKSKKIQIAKNVPEAIKEVKEEVVYDDGIMVRTVPSRLGRNEKKKDLKATSGSKQKEENVDRNQERRENRDKDQERREKRERDSKSEVKSKQDDTADNERREKRENKEKSGREARELRRKMQKEKDDKRRMERYEKSLQKAKDVDQKAVVSETEKAKTSLEKDPKQEPPAKNETKRYSALRKARQEKNIESKDPLEAQQKQNDEDELADGESQNAENTTEADASSSKMAHEELAEPSDSKSDARREARMKRNEERRAREADERAQRQIKNRDRPSMQIYQPKRRQRDDPKPENMKSSDENSETSRKRSDDRRRDRYSDKRPSRKNSKDETSRKKKTSRSEDDVADGSKVSENIAEKLESLNLSQPQESSETSTAPGHKLVDENDKESENVQE